MRFSLFFAERVTLSRLIAADRRAYRLHPTHQPTSHARAMKELGDDIKALDRHLVKRRAEDKQSLTRRLLAWLAGI